MDDEDKYVDMFAQSQQMLYYTHLQISLDELQGYIREKDPLKAYAQTFGFVGITRRCQLAYKYVEDGIVYLGYESKGSNICDFLYALNLKSGIAIQADWDCPGYNYGANLFISNDKQIIINRREAELGLYEDAY
ncbi:hypothetical protein MASR2M15_12620 [Anaerolineales bacterium]